MADAVMLEALPAELRSRVMAATAHAQHRLITRRSSGGQDPPAEGYQIYALAGDRFVHMMLALRPDGSVEETTQTLLRNQIVRMVIEDDQAAIEVEDAAGRRSIAIPVDTATALGDT
jgi:hypothetical protein